MYLSGPARRGYFSATCNRHLGGWLLAVSYLYVLYGIVYINSFFFWCYGKIHVQTPNTKIRVCRTDVFYLMGHTEILMWLYLFNHEPLIIAPENPDIKLLFESYPGIMCCSIERLAL